MFLFILESLGTSELILIGIVALMFLGPRRLPDIARKAGKIMADLRNTAGEFRTTWEKEVNFEEEAKSLSNLLEDDSDVKTEPIPRENSIVKKEELTPSIDVPAVKQIDKATFDAMTKPADESTPVEKTEAEEPDLLSDKRNWL